MKLSTRGRYGLRALIDIAMHEQEGAVSLQSIGERQSVSPNYLEQIIRRLRQDGLVVSVRGAGGGYRLGRPADQISVGDILRSLEGSLSAVECPAVENPEAGGMQNRGDASCVGADVCVTKYVWKRINDAITAAVDGIFLSELAEEGSMRSGHS